MFACIKCLRILQFARICEHFMHANTIFPLIEAPGAKATTKMGVISLKIVQFSIQNHCWKAPEVYNSEMCRIYMQVNCLWPKFTKFSCDKHNLKHKRLNYH